MSEQNDPKPAGTASNDPHADPSPAPPGGGRTSAYQAGPVTFAGLPIQPTSASEPPHDPLPLELEPMTARIATPGGVVASNPVHDETPPPLPLADEPSETHTNSPADPGSPAGGVSDAPAAAPLSLEAWLAAAPVEELDTIEAVTKAAHESPPPLPPADEAVAGIMPADDLSPGQPVDVMPIPGMTPITEQERAKPDLLEPAPESPSVGDPLELMPAPASVGGVDALQVTTPVESVEPVEPLDPPELFDIASEADSTPAPDTAPASVDGAEEEVSFDTWEPDALPASTRPTPPAANEPPSPFEGLTASDAATLAGSPDIAAKAIAAPADVAPTPAATDKPATLPVEPTPVELAAIPPERDAQVALPAIAAGELVTSADAPETVHEQTASEVFAHAHEDVEARRGLLSYGLLTKLAGIVGLLSCIAVLAILLTACAGLTPMNSEKLQAFNGYLMWVVIGLAGILALQIAVAAIWKVGVRSAVQTGLVTLVAGGLWVAIAMFHDQAAGFDLLAMSKYLVEGAAGGLGLAIVGGFIEHRRLREETHVLAAVFANLLAGLGALSLWAVSEGYKIFPGGGGGAG